MNPLYIGFPAVIAGTVLSYAIREYLEGKLTVEQIGSIALAQRTHRLRLYSVMGAVLLLLLGARLVTSDIGRPLFYTLLAAVVLGYLWFYAATYKAAASVLSPSQRPLLMAAQVCAFVGLATLAASMAAT
jgi:hypothetical protein